MFRLLRYFSILSFVAIVIVAGLLGTFYHRVALNDLTQLAESRNVALTQTFANSLWNEFAPFVASAKRLKDDQLRTRPEVTRLRYLVLDQMRGVEVVKIKVYDLAGRTVFSTESKQIGEDKSNNLGFLSARSGKVASELTHRDTFSAFEGTIEDRDVFASYVPLRRDSTGSIEGVFELYYDVTPDLHKIKRTQRIVVLSVILVLSLLYGALVLIVRHADRIMGRQDKERREYFEGIRETNETLEQRVQERTRQLYALHEINLAVTSTLDLDVALKVLMERIESFFPYAAVQIWLMNTESGVLERAACRNLDEAVWKERELKDTPALVKEAIASKAPVVAENVQTDPRTLDPEFYRRQGFVSYLGVPVVAKGEVLGVLVVLTKEQRQFPKEEIESLSTLVGQAAIAIHNSQLYKQTSKQAVELEQANEKLQFRNDELETLQEINQTIFDSTDLRVMMDGILSKIFTVGGFDVGLVCLSMTTRETLEPVASRGFRDLANVDRYRTHMRERSTAGIVDQVITNSKVRIVDLTQTEGVRTFRREGVQSLAVVPLLAETEALGVIYLGSRRERKFEPREVRILEGIGIQAGIAVQKDRLLEQARKKSEEFEALVQINKDVASLLDKELLLPRIAKEARQILRVDGAIFRLIEGDSLVLAGTSDTQNLGFRPRIGIGESLSGRVVQENRVLTVRNVLQDTRMIEEHRQVVFKAGFRAFLGIPLRRGQRVIGALNLYSVEERDFQPDEIGLITAFADQAATAIHNCELYEQTRKQAVELEQSNQAKDQFLQVMGQQKEELARLNSGLQSEIAERGRAKAELAAKNRDLETLLYVTSHDLREPLRAIENFSRMVNDRYGERLDEKGRDFLRRVIQGAQRLNRLLDDILTLSRSQRMTAPTEEVDGESIVLEALKRLEGKIQTTEAQVRVAKSFRGLRVDRTWATQAVYNLIANALKFTRDGEPPDIEIAPYQPQGSGSAAFGIAVRDRGPGVASEHAERIFQLFQRAVGREIDGTGAGLAIVRQIAERHGGSAWVEPREGGGSEFIITFGQAERIEGGNYNEY
jgi:GAF domain-containing protein